MFLRSSGSSEGLGRGTANDVSWGLALGTNPRRRLGTIVLMALEKSSLASRLPRQFGAFDELCIYNSRLVEAI